MAERARVSIIEELRRMIVTGAIEPGSIVGEADLVELLGCGRTPLREALLKLENEGLVDLPPRRGVLIPSLSITEYQETRDALECLDTAWMALCTERITAEQLGKLRHINEQMGEAEDEGDFYTVAMFDARFHIAIAEASGNRFITRWAGHLYTAAARFAYRMFAETGEAGASLSEHLAIVDALETRDAEAALARVRAHNEGSSARLLAVMLGSSPAI